MQSNERFRSSNMWDTDKIEVHRDAVRVLVRRDSKAPAPHVLLFLWSGQAAKASSPSSHSIPSHLMAKLTAHGGPRLLLHGDRLQFTFDSSDPLHPRFGRLRFADKSGGKLIRSSCCGKLSSFRKKRVAGSSSGADQRLDGFDHGAGFEEEEEDFETDNLAPFRGLVLDISYRPVNVVCWKRAICLEFMEKADVLEYYDQTVSSASGSYYIPAVLRVPQLLQVVKRRKIRNHLSRKNIFFRDVFTCQYCSSHDNLTVDHVLPISRGGEWKWENLVTACSKCNSRKGQKTLEEANMKLIKSPKAPKDFEILAIPLTTSAIKMLRMRKGMPDEWRQYLAKSSLEP